MKKYITGRYGSLIEEVEQVRESEVTIWFLNKDGKEDNCRKISGSSRVHDSFDEAKQYLLKKENEHLEKLNNWTKSSIERIDTICALISPIQ